MNKLILAIVLLAFAGLTAVAFATDGLVGFKDAILYNWSSLQIYVDLVIGAGLFMVWVYRDATTRGRSPWPWIVLAGAIGMFSPLIYLLLRPSEPTNR